MNEHQPTDLEAKIVEFTAYVKMYEMPPRKINDEEKSKLKKLKMIVDKLTADGGSGFKTTEGIRPGPGSDPGPDRLSESDLGLP